MKRALLVDDNDELRNSTREYLEEQGYAVTTASDAEEALTATRVPFDLLVSDVYMPGMNGIELADRWISRQPKLAIVLISSRGGEPEVRQRLAQGDIAFLAKPFAQEELMGKVREAVGRVPERRGMTLEAVSAPAPESLEKRAGSTFRFQRAAVQMFGLLVLGLGLGALVSSFDLGAPPLPAPAPGGVTRGLTIEVVQPLGPLTTRPQELVWQSLDGAESYAVSLSAVDGTVLWRADIARPSTDLPGTVQSDLQDNVTYYWSVEALDAEGNLVGRSELAPFAIEPTPRQAEDGS